ncbi:hypothetical protein [Methylobacterium radiotolerans]|uniref:hypothetical protein n=1 Tax=Methylobacterium radiotolerans TaxID=31998 RepID=UPI0038CFD70C
MLKSRGLGVVVISLSFITFAQAFVPLQTDARRADINQHQKLNIAMASAQDYTGVFRTTQITCPQANAGILVQIQKNANGATKKIRYKISSQKIVKLILEIADPGKGFRTIGAYDLETEGPGERRVIANELTKQVEPYLEHVCHDSKFRKAYEAEIEAYRFVMNTQDDESSEDEKSNGSLGLAPFQTIKVRCPNDMSFGLMEKVRSNPDGYIARLRFVIKDGRMTSAIAEAAPPNGDLKVTDAVDIEIATSEKERARIKKIIDQEQPTIDNYCNNSANRTRFDAMMRTNRSAVRQDTKRSLIAKGILDAGDL